MRTSTSGHDDGGGHLIEGNTFRNSDSFEVWSESSQPILIRNNKFINTYHAIAIVGTSVHLLDNEISAPEPDKIPFASRTSRSEWLNSLQRRIHRALTTSSRAIGSRRIRMAFTSRFSSRRRAAGIT